MFKSLSVRLQMTAIFLSFVGLAFGIKSYIHIKEIHEVQNIYNDDVISMFLNDLWVQIGVSVLVNCWVAFVLYQIVTKPIKMLTHTMDSITENKLDMEVPYIKQKTEIGAMARCVQIFKENAIAKFKLEENQKQEAIKNEKLRKETMLKVANDFEQGVKQIIDGLSIAARSVHSSSEGLAKVIDAVENEAVNISSATRDTSDKINSIASASEQLTSSIEHVMRKIVEATDTIDDSVKKTDSANELVENLGKVSDEIGDIIKMIQEITEKINLLALNATIEAARAGSAGKGFAVVANEVKNLATQTNSATEEITSKVKGIQFVAEQVNTALGRIKTSIYQANEATNVIKSAAEEQSKSTSEISGNMQVAANNASAINDNISGVSREAQSAKKTSIKVLEEANNMINEINNLNKQTEAFLKNVREG